MLGLELEGLGLTFMLTKGTRGRTNGTACWGGASNVFWWADREKGVGGFIAFNLTSFGDEKVVKTYTDNEIEVYKVLGNVSVGTFRL